MTNLLWGKIVVVELDLNLQIDIWHSKEIRRDADWLGRTEATYLAKCSLKGVMRLKSRCFLEYSSGTTTIINSINIWK